MDWCSDLCSSDLLDRAIDLGPAPDQRIDLAVLGLLVEVDRELLERAFALGLVGLGGFLVVCALGGRRFGGRAALADAVADEADRVEPAHLLLLEEIDRIALTLGEQGDEPVGAGHLVARSEAHTSEIQSLL